MSATEVMPSELYQSNSVMTIRFGGTDKINSKLFTDFVDNASFLLEESTKSICPDAKIKLNISAIRPGSFVFDLQTVVDAIPMTNNVFAIASSATGIFLGILQIKNWLRGKKPDQTIDSGDKISIVKNGGTVIVDKRTYNLYMQPEINIKVSNIFFDLNEDGTKNSFDVSYGDETFSVPSSDFEDLSVPEAFDSPNDDSDQFESFISDTQLKIRKAVLEGRSKWNFYNGTRAIDATMADDDFLDNVKRRIISFSSGDRLQVSLQTEYQIDEYGFPVKDTERFTVIKVNKIIEFVPNENRQMKLDV